MPRTALLAPEIPLRCSAPGIGHGFKHHWDLMALSLLLILANRTLLDSTVNSAWTYHPIPLEAGEWWRLASYAFVHLSWYHLLLDAGAFFLLYTGLKQTRCAVRLAILAACSAGSLLFGVWLGTAQQLGLAGLSGVDHGLMAIAALQLMRSADQRKWGLAGLALVVGKSAFELATGHVVFGALHGGMCGIPVAASHAGGVLAGMLAFMALESRRHLLKANFQRAEKES